MRSILFALLVVLSVEHADAAEQMETPKDIV
jgi:hypothetical protein